MNIKMKKGGGHRIYSPRGLTSNPAPQLISGADPEISERGGGGGRGGSQILERGGGGGIRLFSAAFSHFLINLLQIFQQKGEGGGGRGGAARTAPPLNPRLNFDSRHKI